jgi:DNA-binding NtrC family response regulator
LKIKINHKTRIGFGCMTLITRKINNFAAKHMKMHRILIIDDEQSIRRTLREILEYEKYQVEDAETGMEGLQKISEQDFDVILCDIKMPEMDGIETLEAIKQITDCPVIMISGHGTIETAVEAIKKGAYDYIAKPPDLNRLLITIKNALDKSQLITEAKALKKAVSKHNQMIGQSAPMDEIREMIQKVAPTAARVLISGENGTGKELVARQLHELSSRSHAPFIEVNCAAIPSELIESQLFGHEKGAFTSAIKQRKGDFELAHGGTLFLDEIGDMSLSAQAKVLRALQENKITRVGGEKEIPVDVRIIAATNKNLKEEINKGRFREDLYHRISVIVIHVPPLRERLDDIPLLVQHFVELSCAKMGKPLPEFTEEAMAEMQQYQWTGNIRELNNAVERLVILGGSPITEKTVKQFARPLNN